MGEAGGFELAQLVELAGLACAMALAKTFPGEGQRVLILCGPGPSPLLRSIGRNAGADSRQCGCADGRTGNQGADGLCAARHLLHFGYQPRVYLPKPGKKPFYQSLVKQCENLDIEFVDPSAGAFKTALEESDVLMDAIFGSSLSPTSSVWLVSPVLTFPLGPLVQVSASSLRFGTRLETFSHSSPRPTCPSSRSTSPQAGTSRTAP